MSENFQKDRTFFDNILLVGQTGCGKTSFVQSLGKNKIFGDGLISVDWVPKINLTKSREDEIRECFSYTIVEFHYPDDLSDFNLLKHFKKIHLTMTTKRQKKTMTTTIVTFLERKKNDKLIVMDDASGLADKSNDFSTFLTVSRKFGFICLYIFHIIYPSKSIWQMI